MDSSFLLFVLEGFVAQIIDGALRIAYGASADAFLLSLRLPAAAASTSVHAAKMVTTDVSGLSHLGLRNVKGDLPQRLLLPCVIGGVIGAHRLTAVPGDVVAPVVSLYLAVMGPVILWKAFHQAQEWEVKTTIVLLGLIGGFFDAIGGATGAPS